eukprot:XP_011683845.1 PREDICTED: C5a anaphylatoxin chemotactic receptor 1-like [Strongylocentrotus purpuratus]
MDVGSVAIFCVIFITGLPGNTIILAAYAIKPQKKSTDLLIIIQALVDLIACITPQSEMISGVAICWITLIIRLSTSLSSLFLTFVIAVDRYVTVCRPFGRHLTKTQAVALATLCLAFSFFINLTILCPPQGHVAGRDGPPSASIEISATQSSAAAVGHPSQPGKNSGYNRPIRRANGDRTTKMLLCITIVLIISWIPYVLVFALPTHVYIHLVTKITSHQVVYSITRIRGFNHMINAFVYWAVNPIFRQDVKRVFIRLRKLTNR